MTAQSASKETTLDLVDRQVETPVCAARRRRYWLVWWLWAVFGAAVSFRGMPAGGLLIAAAVLTAPFWVLFAVWPILWLRDHRRSKTLWAEETAVLLAPNPQQSASDSSADAQGGIALPVILGHERESSGEGILIPMLGREAAFPTLEPKRMGLHLVAADTLPGVHLPALDAGDLLAFSGWNQSAQSFGASEDDWQAARRWTEHLRTVLAGKVF